MSEDPNTDKWEKEGQDALDNFTQNLQNDSDFEDFEIATNVNSTPLNERPSKSNFNPSLNILSPAVNRREEDDSYKTLNTAQNDTKVINSDDHNLAQNSLTEKTMHTKFENISNLSRGSSVEPIRMQFNITQHEVESVRLSSHAVWDRLEVNFRTEQDGSCPTTIIDLSTPLLTYQDAIQHFKNTDLSMYEPDIIASINLTGIAKFFAQLCGPPRLKSLLKSEKTFVFCLARCQFDNDDPKDFQLLMTIFKCLTGSTLDCDRYGSHWQDIGFQGNDPATDLRGTGMLSLVTILHLVQNHQFLSQKLYQLSLNENQCFPFCIFMINITKIVLVALRNGYLNKECNKRLGILPVIMDIFIALVNEHYKIWLSEKKTIADSSYVIKMLEDKTKSTTVCANLLTSYRKKCNERELGVYEKSDIVFLDVCKDGKGIDTSDYENKHKTNKKIKKYLSQ